MPHILLGEISPTLREMVRGEEGIRSYIVILLEVATFVLIMPIWDVISLL